MACLRSLHCFCILSGMDDRAVWAVSIDGRIFKSRRLIESRAIAHARSSDRCRVLESAHGKTLVQRKGRFFSDGQGFFRPGIPARWRTVGVPESSDRPCSHLCPQ